MAGSLFSAEIWAKLQTHPEAAALFADPSFRTMVDEIRNDPSALSKHISDPRVLKLFSIAAQQSNAAASQNTGMTEVTDMDAEDGAPVQQTKEAPKPKPAPASPQPVPEEQLTDAQRSLKEKERGTEAYKKRDFETAIACYTKALELDPDNMSLLTNRAAAKLEAGDMHGCIEDCQAAIDQNAERGLRTDFKIIARAYGRMGNAYLKLEDFDNAISSFEKSLVEFSDSKITRALREAERTKAKRAEEAYINPEISQQVRAEGNELFKAGKFPESIAKYTEAIKRNPKDAAPFSNRAAAYMKLGEFPMAKKDCDRCLEIDPTFVKAYIRKGNIHFFMKEFHKCLTVYEKGLKLDPKNKELQQGLMKTQIRIQEQQNSGQVDEAQVKQAMQDPEIQQILSDPQVNNMLKQMQEDPKFAAQAMRDPEIASKVQKLIAAGVLRVG